MPQPSSAVSTVLTVLAAVAATVWVARSMRLSSIFVVLLEALPGYGFQTSLPDVSHAELDAVCFGARCSSWAAAYEAGRQAGGWSLALPPPESHSLIPTCALAHRGRDVLFPVKGRMACADDPTRPRDHFECPRCSDLRTGVGALGLQPVAHQEC